MEYVEVYIKSCVSMCGLLQLHVLCTQMKKSSLQQSSCAFCVTLNLLQITLILPSLAETSFVQKPFPHYYSPQQSPLCQKTWLSINAFIRLFMKIHITKMSLCI